MAAKKKVNWSKEVEQANEGVEVKPLITDVVLSELCPNIIQKRFKAAKTPAARADLLYELTHNELKALRSAFQTMDDFLGKLEQWFVQEFQDDQRGVTGKFGRVEIKTKEVPTVVDWAKFYAHLAKKKEFELLNKALNGKAVKERWENGKEVPGVGKFSRKSVSLTRVQE
jgi:hypothetical protein